MNKQTDATTLKVALAALGHDVGKFLQEYLPISPEYERDNAGLYQRFTGNHYSHRHALYTAAFIEQYKAILPDELNATHWGEGEPTDSFINLAAAHHNPRTALQQIVTTADCLSSGLDRAEFQEGKNVAPQHYRSTRLCTLFEQLAPHAPQDRPVPASAEALKWHYPLLPLGAENIFPMQGEPRTDRESSKTEYRKLCEAFLADLAKLANRDNVFLWMQHFDSLLHVYTAQIPAARAGKVIPDVSLYDHCRTTSALAAALYLYHRGNDTLNETAIQDGSAEKFLLVSGDFYGIQDFIFSAGDDSSANRSKLLRGRSFYVSLFCELAADLLCRETGLPPTAVVLNAGGKFTLLAPNTDSVRKAIECVRQALNRHLYEISYGQSSFGLICSVARQDELTITEDRFAELWRRHKKDMEKAKACKLDFAAYGGVVGNYLDSFKNDLNPPLCPLCGIRPSVIKPVQKGEKAVCNLCHDHVVLGTKLVRQEQENRILVLLANSPADKTLHGELGKAFLGLYQICFRAENELAQMSSLPEGVVRIWKTGINADGSVSSTHTNRFLNGHVPVYAETDLADERLIKNRRDEDQTLLEKGAQQGWPKTFGDIARIALEEREENGTKKLFGVPALGVLKADVDQLGLLMACGLPKMQATISRMAALSRQLDSFFSVFLPHFLRRRPRFHNVYTVFAGGDDLFLIGPWNHMTELALALNEQFTDFTCHNGEIHFSAGIVVAKSQTPVSRLANQAEEALEHSKNAGRNRITVFGETVIWPDLTSIFAHGETLDDWRERLLSRALFYRLNSLVGMAAEEKRLLDAKAPVPYNNMHCLRWRALLQYQLVRNLKVKDEAARKQALDELKKLGEWLHEHGGAMKIPLWHVLYNNRAYGS
ncbi:MAG: type III-A CRISPR-associated protein Cas10/Csm1 [Deltaproteobacteria bacterium]|nr:type III-A CRISPR-associated protein Cas10/Csm1 [Deltaproteobacteria bacterium]